MHKVKFVIEGNETQVKKAQDMLMNISLKHNILVEIAHKIKEDLEVPVIQPYLLSNNTRLDDDYKKFYSAYAQATNDKTYDGYEFKGI